MTPSTRYALLIVGAALVALVAATPWLWPATSSAGPTGAVPQIGRVFTVTQFVQPGSGPLWTTRSKTLFFIHGVLRRAPMQPVADFVLSDNGAQTNGEGGLALAAASGDGLDIALARFALLRPLLPRSVDNPLLGVPATFRVLWTGCPARGCSRSPWQLASGGE